MNTVRHLVSVNDFDDSFVSLIMLNADRWRRHRLQKRPDWHLEPLSGRLLITDFYEPSTRTRLSFEAAMSYLGGRVIGTENAAEFSSAKKGESIGDNFETISGFCDGIVGRFRHAGEAAEAARHSLVPVINGGDGSGEHPTQALIDYFTIYSGLHDGDGVLTFFGDNKRSRTVRSLASLLAMGATASLCKMIAKVNFISPPELMVDYPLLVMLKESGIEVTSKTAIDTKMIRESDVVYVTRSQNERSDEHMSGDQYVFTNELADLMPEHGLIMHPLPRNSELPPEVDQNPRACYFKQAHNGLYVRMALLEQLIR